MKKFIRHTIICCCLLLSIVSALAQTLYGTTYTGGNDGNGGTINKFIPATNVLEVLKSFESPAENIGGSSDLIQAANGTMYGMVSQGGATGYGVIFSFEPSSSTYKNVKDFNIVDGVLPHGSLLQATDGKLYGMTTYGGNGKAGVIFSFDPVSAIYIKLMDFDRLNREYPEDNIHGAYPFGSLIQAKDGKLYGMTSAGGSRGNGVIFSFDPSTSTYKKILDFNENNGSRPHGSLIQATDGKLYGTTTGGGDGNNFGVIFSVDPSSSTFTKLKDFDGTNGASPYGSFIQWKDGKLYGLASFGGSNFAGAVFSFDPATADFSKLSDFDGANGANPTGNLVEASDGKLYGTTGTGGSTGTGVIFYFDPVSPAVTKLKDFHVFDGAKPYGSLLRANDGKLYGLTSEGGVHSGVIFSLDPAPFTFTVVKHIGTSEDGSYLPGGLVQAASGRLYGMTAFGGDSSGGVIFSFDPVTYRYMKLKDFYGSDGVNPRGSLVQARDGKLYGMTSGGGSKNGGVIFSFDPSGSVYKKLKDFSFTDGHSPMGSLIQHPDGKLYGVTTYGGSSFQDGNNYGNGVIFSWDPVSSTYTLLKDFGFANGAYPYGSLTLAGNGKLYGLTSSGGSREGVLFSFDPLTSNYTMLNDFAGTNGSHPYGTLVNGTDGKLYGTAGIIFSFDPFSSTFQQLRDIDTANTGNPYGTLMQASDGKLYGITSQGSGGHGFIFSFDPSGSVYTRLKDFTGLNGESSLQQVASAFIELKDSVAENAPTIVLTTPADSSTYLAGKNVLLSASASDKDGQITAVQFYINDTLLKTSTHSPYTYLWKNVLAGNYIITAKATDNSGLFTTSGKVHISVIANKPPIVKIIKPADNETFLKGATIHFQATAFDPDGKISKVAFYNGTTLLTTEYKVPYTLDWRIGRAGNYAITARATDDRGAITTSEINNVSVVPNQVPAVSIVSPFNGQTFTASANGATINIEASANDADGRIAQVKFYNATNLLTVEHKVPYTYQWNNVPVGTYTLTAVAKDNWSGESTSAPVLITVVAAGVPIVSNKRSAPRITDRVNPSASLQLAPNPVKDILNLSTKGFETGRAVTISVMAASGSVLQTRHVKNFQGSIKVNVLGLASGIYTIKVLFGHTILYRKFVKM